MPQWPFTLNWDHPYCVGLNFAWFFVGELGGIDLTGNTQLSAIVNVNSTVTFPLSGRTGGPIVNFTGSTTTADRVNLGNITSANPLKVANGPPFAFTSSFILDSGVTSFPRLLDISDEAFSSNGWAVFFEDDARLWLQADGGSNRHRWTSATSGIDFGEEHTITINCSTTTSSVLHVDGSDAINPNDTGTLSFSATTTAGSIGNWNHTTGRQWDGDVDFVEVHGSRLLEDAEIWMRHDYGHRWDHLYPLGRTKIFLPPAEAVVAAATHPGWQQSRGGWF